MAVSKRRLGRTRIHHRRSSWMRSAASPATVQKCPTCEQPKMPHRVCAACGHYGGKQVIEVAANAVE